MSPRDLKIPGERHPEKAHRPDNAQPKKPDWIRVKAPTSEGYRKTRDIMREHKLVTVCEEAGCPNVGECWSQGHATMMIMGEICTRGCTFCNVATGRPDALDVVRARPRRRCRREAGAEACRHHLGRPRRSRRRRGRAFRPDDPRHPPPRARDHDRDPDAGLPEVRARRAGSRRRRKPGRLQPQPRNRAGPLPRGPSRRALLPLAAPAAAGEGARPRDVHQVRHHGRPRRGPAGGAAGDGRHALGRCRFPDHRPVPAADAEAPRASTAS